MHTKVIKLDDKRVDIAKIKEAARLIDMGGLVAFPTETVYGIACRAKIDSLNALNNLKGRNPDKHYTLHIGQKNDVRKYVPKLGLKAEKLVKNAWPGPLTIVFEIDAHHINYPETGLDKETFEILYRDNTVGIRCPDNTIASMLLQMTKNSVVAPSANITGQQPAVDGQQVLAYFEGQIEMLLDAGSCRYKKSSTVVKVSKKGLEILRPGVYPPDQLEALSQIKFLFVCTGNTCRSPMAVGIFRKYLAEKLQCSIDQLDKMGYKIISAGILDMAGTPASPEAIAACAAKGIDIKNHKSTTLSRQLIKESDFIYAMTKMHCEQIRRMSPEDANKCILLAEHDIADPVGQPQRVFNNCADLIEQAVKKRISELVI